MKDAVRSWPLSSYTAPSSNAWPMPWARPPWTWPSTIIGLISRPKSSAATKLTKEGAFYDPTNFTFPAGAYICELEVDSATGKTSFVNFVADIGAGREGEVGRVVERAFLQARLHAVGQIVRGIGRA